MSSIDDVDENFLQKRKSLVATKSDPDMKTPRGRRVSFLMWIFLLSANVLVKVKPFDIILTMLNLVRILKREKE
jgi:hypothetical protein